MAQTIKELVRTFLENPGFKCLNLENINTELTVNEFESLVNGYTDRYSYSGFEEHVEEFFYNERVKLIFVYNKENNKIVLINIYAYRF